MRIVAAALAMVLGAGLAAARARWVPVAPGTALESFEWGVGPWRFEAAAGDWRGLAEALAGWPRLLVAAAALLAAAGWARGLARRGRLALPWPLAALPLAAALFFAADPALAGFVAQRDALMARAYLDVEHALRGLGIAAVLCGVLALLPRPARSAQVGGGPGTNTGASAAMGTWLHLGGAGLLCAGLALALERGVLGGEPLTNDGHAYHFQAKLFESGRASLPHGPAQAFFPGRQLWPGSEEVPRVFAKYPPGHSAVLAAGGLLGERRLFVLLGAFLSPALVWVFARKVRAPAPHLAAWLFALSPAPASAFGLWLAWGTSLPAALAALAAGAWALERAARGAPILWPALATGAALSLLGATRPGTGVALALVLALAAALAAPRRAPALLGWGTLAALPAALCFALFNLATTGDALQPAYVLYAQVISPDDRWGLVNLPSAFANTSFNLARLDRWAFGIGGGLLLIALGALLRRTEREAPSAQVAPWAWLAWGAPLALLAFYALLTFHGVPWAGPVYLLEGFGGLAVLGAAALAHLGAARGRIAVGIVLVAISAGSADVLARQWNQAADVQALRRAPQRLADQAGLERGVVFVPLASPQAIRLHHLAPPVGSAERIFARDLGPANRALLGELGNPPAWRYDPAGPRLVPLAVEARD